MQSARKNHPWKRIFAGRDEISREESSRGEIFYPQGCNQRGRIILGREFLLAEMQPAEKNHPRKRILIRRDAISEEKSSLREIFIRRDEISIAEGTAFSELSSGEILSPTTFRIDPKGHWRAGYLQNKMPSRADRTIIRMGEGAVFRSLLQAR